MPSLTVREWIQIGAIVLMIIGVVLVVKTPRLFERDGVRRATQFMSVILVLPTIIILALQEVLKGETVGTLIGALIGYLLSGVGSAPPGSAPASQSSKNAAQTSVAADAPQVARH